MNQALQITAQNLGENYNTVELEVFYSKGGVNYFNYRNEARGYYFRVQAMQVERDDNGNVLSKAFLMFGDDNAFKYLLEKTGRLNRKKLADLQDKVYRGVDQAKAVELYRNGDKAALVEMVLDALDQRVAA